MTTISYHEHLGYRALEQGENPHEFWQFSEYLKREKNDKSKCNPDKLDTNRGRKVKINVASREKHNRNNVGNTKKRAINKDEGQEN